VILVLLVRREIATEMAEKALRRGRDVNTAEPTWPGAGVALQGSLREGREPSSPLSESQSSDPPTKSTINLEGDHLQTNNHSAIPFLRYELYESTHVHFIIPSPWPPLRRKLLKRLVRCILPSAARSGGMLQPRYSVQSLQSSIMESFYEQALILFLIDYTLNNPDTLTKYKNAAQISQKVLEAVSALCVAGEKVVTICEKGDKLLEEEIEKVYRGKKIPKGIPHRRECPYSSLTVNLRHCFPNHGLPIFFCHTILPAHLRRGRSSC
jgi:hypothetical protein